MIRLTFLSLALITLAQLMPEGCPTTTMPGSTERGTIETSATAPTSANAGQEIKLRASATTDEEGGQLYYSWLQTGGPGVGLADADKAIARFFAPSLPAAQTLNFAVTTRNDRGDVGKAEVSVSIAIDLNYMPPSNERPGGSSGPTASAGADREIEAGDLATLNAGGSRGTGLRYLWRQTSGTTVQLSDDTASTPTFTAPEFVEGGDNTLTFALQVTDSRNRTATDSVVLTVVPRSETPEPSEGPRVRISTTLGDFVVQLNETAAPTTVENFLQYVDDGFYSGTLFHRVISGFVVQGGGFTSGLVQKSTRPAIPSEANNGLRNDRGTIAMARTSDPNSATSQFYVNLVDNASLNYSATNPGYTVFGTVVEGLDVIDQIAAQPTESRQGFQDVPVTDILVLSATRL